MREQNCYGGDVVKEVIKDYKDLKVWHKALEVVCDIIELIDLLPPGSAKKVIGEQIIGSSSSVCSNIAEGHNSGSSREFHRILKIAFRQAKETDNWLQVIKRSRKFAEPKIVGFADRIEARNLEVIKMLASLKESIKIHI